jgi:hypothetical protein
MAELGGGLPTMGANRGIPHDHRILENRLNSALCDGHHSKQGAKSGNFSEDRAECIRGRSPNRLM